jgi:spermidine synthase
MEKTGFSPKKYYIYLTVFITGAAILILEILGTRIIAPYYGTTLFVWSALIGVTLLALTAGYFLGGWLSDRRPGFEVMYLVIFAASAAIFAVPFISPGVLEATNSMGPRAGALLSAAALFSVPLLLLGMVSPYAVRLSLGEILSAGMTAGSLYAVSTVGSFIGAIVTGFYLIPAIGIKAIIDLITALLILISLGWFIFVRKSRLSMVLMVIFLFAMAAKSHTDDVSFRRNSETLFDRQTAYSRLKVVDFMGRYRAMVINNAMQTLYDIVNNEFEIGYIKMFGEAAGCRKAAKTALSIGLGGGAIDSALKKRGLAVDNVEIDPEIVGAARKYFGFSGHIIIDDGRHFVRNTVKKYDLIYLDAFNGFAIAQYLLSREALMEMKSRLNPGGMLVVNTVGRLKNDGGRGVADDRLVRAVNSTLTAVFKNVSVHADVFGICNYVYCASEDAIDGKISNMPVAIADRGPVITDDYNPVESLTLDIIEDWRAEEIRRLGSIFVL